MEGVDLEAIVESLLFATDEPLSVKEIQSIVEVADKGEILATLAALQKKYEVNHHSFCVMQVAGGYQLYTRAQFAGWVKRLYRGRRTTRLSQAALEVLAIVAYRQPISRLEIDEIRGVSSGGVLKTLLDRGLIRIVGRSKGLGRPLLYGTTQEFLRYFGLNNLKELPKLEEFNELLKSHKTPHQLDLMAFETSFQAPDPTLHPESNETEIE